MLKAYETSGDILFQEQQHFPAWIKLLTIGIVVLATVVVLIGGVAAPTNKRAEMWFALAVMVTVDLLLLAIFHNVTFEKVVTTNGIYFRWRPWQQKFRVIGKEEIRTFEGRNRPPLHFGIGWFPGYGWTHNANMAQGIQLYLEDERKFFLGTANNDQFEAAIRNLTSSNPKPNSGDF